MKVVVTNVIGDVFTLDVSPDLELINFKALCEFECGISSQQCSVLHEGVLLRDDQKSLGDHGVKDGDMLQVHVQQPSTTTPVNRQQDAAGASLFGMDFSQIAVPGASGQSVPPTSHNQQQQLQQQQQQQQQPQVSLPQQGSDPDPAPAQLREMFLSNPHQLSLLKERNRPLADALLSGNLEMFKEVLMKQRKERSERELMQIRMMNADPFDPNTQQQIAETIRLKNVEANMENAMEHAPESFGQVVMLYIDCRVNSYPVKAFVDSGAQMTIMSQACAERCSIMRLVDKRWAGIAKGVGTQKIIGRVHLGQIQIGPDFLQSSFAILEEQPMDMLLGLDMLKRHQCCIDLKNNVLKIGTTGTETPFLGEAELPPCTRLNRTESLDEAMMEAEDKRLAEAIEKSANESPGASTSAAANTGSATNIPSLSAPYLESTISELTSMGFQRDEILVELQRHNGNKQMAMAALFAKNLKIPGQK